MGIFNITHRLQYLSRWGEGLLAKVVLVGSPNVGKSVIFNYLTGQYVTVSNYPGTTVDIARGYSSINGQQYEVIDTPGIYSMIPMTEDEKVTRQLLFQEKPDIMIHVIDGKNIQRMLNMTLQFMEATFPVILVVNLMDEALHYGIVINTRMLAEILGITVIGTIATKGIGLENLKQAIGQYESPKFHFTMNFAEDIEQAIGSIADQLTDNYGIPSRAMALLLLQGDRILYERVAKQESVVGIKKQMQGLVSSYQCNTGYVLATAQQQVVKDICNRILVYKKSGKQQFGEKLGKITREPMTGIPILCCVLFFGFYEFVGKFGAGFLVDYVNETIFAQYITPMVENLVGHHIPWEWLQSLVIGRYGIFSLGFCYAFAIILPIVGTFFLMFSILEDSGYLPRLSMLVDKFFKCLGLNGRAVIPFALGVGCGTMAVVVTRTLATRRERLIATFLLSLGIPCSAQMGVILALLSHSLQGIILWGSYLVIVLSGIGWLSAKIIPGKSSDFYMEIPPLRVPRMVNVVSKTCLRVWWYFVEILPIFIITSVGMWYGERSGLLVSIIRCGEPIMIVLGLPAETTQIFLLGFFRRDYGAAGLYEMCASKSLNNEQLVVASVVLTLFVPCIAQVVVMFKERGVLLTLGILGLIIGIAICAGGFLHGLLYWGGITI